MSLPSCDTLSRHCACARCNDSGKGTIRLVHFSTDRVPEIHRVVYLSRWIRSLDWPTSNGVHVPLPDIKPKTLDLSLLHDPDFIARDLMVPWTDADHIAMLSLRCFHHNAKQAFGATLVVSCITNMFQSVTLGSSTESRRVHTYICKVHGQGLPAYLYENPHSSL